MSVQLSVPASLDWNETDATRLPAIALALATRFPVPDKAARGSTRTADGAPVVNANRFGQWCRVSFRKIAPCGGEYRRSLLEATLRDPRNAFKPSTTGR